MRNLVVTLACIFFISACKPSDNYVISLGEDLVKDKLIDPDSAKFNSFFHKSGDLYGYVCGDVNSKKHVWWIYREETIFCLFGSCGRKS